MHICYGYGIKANIEWKSRLGPTWNQYGHLMPHLANSSVDQISLELANSSVPPHVFGLAKGKEVALGVIDVGCELVETAANIVDTLRKALAFVAPERLLASTNCGMAPMKRDVAYAKLRAIAGGTAIINASLRSA